MSKILPANAGKNEKYNETPKIDGSSKKKEENQVKLRPNQFWLLSTTWEMRKSFAINLIKISGVEDQSDIYSLAYQGRTDEIAALIGKDRLERQNQLDIIVKKNDLSQNTLKDSDKNERIRKLTDVVLEAKKIETRFKNNDLELSPLIYAIWGEEDRNDSTDKGNTQSIDSTEGNNVSSNSKATSNLILNYFKEMYKSQFEGFPKSFVLKNEIGHYYIHEILQTQESNQKNAEIDFWLEKFVTGDFHHAVSYLMEKNKIIIKETTFNHEALNPTETLSIVSFSLKVGSNQCSALFFDYIIRNFSKLKTTEIVILENEISDYLSFNEKNVKKLVDGFTFSQEKSFWVNIDKVPDFKMITPSISPEGSSSVSIEETAYETFDNMYDAAEFIKSKIINSKIKLPSIIGSQSSLKIIQFLAQAPELKLFQIDIIKYYLEYKWNSLQYLIYTQCFLVWATIPMIVYLVLVTKYDIRVLIPFTIVNFFLAVFELLELFSMNIFKYLGDVDRIQTCLVLRLFTLILMIIPNFQPFSCTLYMILSVFLLPNAENTKSLLVYLSILAFYVLAIFPAFWARFSYVGYLMIAVGSVGIVVLCIPLFWVRWREFSCREFFTLSEFNSKLLFKTKKNWLIVNWMTKTVLLALLIVMVFSTSINFGVMILCEFIAVIAVITQLYKGKKDIEKKESYDDHIHKIDEAFNIDIKDLQVNEETKDEVDRYLLKFFIILPVAFIFIVNFFVSGQIAYYIINISALTLTVASLALELKDFLESLDHTESLIASFILVQLTVLGFNLQDTIQLKIVVVVLELCLFMAFKRRNKIKISLLFNNTVRLLMNWNTLDITRISLSAIWIINHYLNIMNQELTYSLVVLILLRGLTSFRCFKITRYYVRLILNSAQEILPFLLIFFYTTISFGAICSVFRDISISDIWTYPYDLSIASAEHDDELNINYFSFLAAKIVNVVIILNLLISVLGDSFDQFQVNAVEFDYLEMAQTLSEYESMLFWRRNKEDPGAYLVGIFVETKAISRKGKVTKNEFLELKEMVKSMRDGMHKRFKVSNKKISKRFESDPEDKKEEESLKSGNKIVQKPSLQSHTKMRDDTKKN